MTTPKKRLSRYNPASEHFKKEEFPFYWLTRVNGRYSMAMEKALKKIDLDVPRYRILFTLDNHTPALREAGSRLKHQRNGYVLRVEHGALMLYTWRILQHFTPKTLGDFLARYQVPGRPIIELDNGWYDVEVLAGALVRDGLYEPAFEFVLKKRWSRGEAADVDTGYAFGLRGYFD